MKVPRDLGGDELAQVLRRCGSYGTVSKAYRVIDQYVADRLRRFLVRRYKGTHHGTQRFPDARLYQEYGLHRLQGARVW